MLFNVVNIFWETHKNLNCGYIPDLFIDLYLEFRIESV